MRTTDEKVPILLGIAAILQGIDWLIGIVFGALGSEPVKAIDWSHSEWLAAIAVALGIWILSDILEEMRKRP